MPSRHDAPQTVDRLIRSTVANVPAGSALVALARFTYEPGSFFGPAAGPGPVVFHMLAGRLTFSAEGPVMFSRLSVNPAVDPEEIVPGTSFDVNPGDQLLVPGNTPHTARSSGGVTAAILGFAIFPQAPPQQFPAGIQFIPLVLGMANSLPETPVAVSLDRVVYETNSSRSRWYSGPALCYVESGSIRLVTLSGDTQISRAQSTGPFGQLQAAPVGTDVVLSIGDGLVIQPGASLTLRNIESGAATLLEGAAQSEGRLATEVARQYFYEAWGNGDTSLIDAICAPSLVNHNLLNGQRQGADGLKQFVRCWRNAFPDTSVSIDLSITQQPKSVTRWTVRGTHQKPFLGIEPTGKAIEVTGITIFRIEAGVIRESWSQWRFANLLRQIGVIQWPDTNRAQ